MKCRVRKEILVGLLVISVILGMAVIIHAGGTEKNEDADYAEIQDARDGHKYTSHEPIYINGNEDFTEANVKAPAKNPETLYVGSGPGNDSATIQGGIDLASAGDNVFVWSGTYYEYENVVIGKTINLIGEDRNTTIIDGGGGGDVVYISADWVNMSGFNMRYGEIGVHLYSSSNSTVTDCVACGGSYGVFIDSSFGIRIDNILCSGMAGVRLYSSSNTYIINCSTSYGNEGIIIISSSNSTITNSRIHGTMCGMYLSLSSNNNITYCNITSSSVYGLYVTEDSHNNWIHHNNLVNNDQNAYDECSNYWDDGTEGNYWSDFDEPSEGAYDNNTDAIVDTPYAIPGGSNMDNYPFMNQSGWEEEQGLIPHDPIYINGNDDFASQAENAGWAGDGTEENPYIIENYDINASTAHGIHIEKTDVYFIIRNCTIHDGKSNWKEGIYFSSVQNGKMDNVTSYDNNYGFYLYSSSNNSITDSAAYNNLNEGILLDYSSDNYITSCTIYNNLYGIHLNWCSNNTLIGNTLTGNSIFIWWGDIQHWVHNIDDTNTVNGKPVYYFLDQTSVTINGWETGQIILANCTGFIIKNVEISNSDMCIEIGFSTNITITNCTIHNNKYGIRFYNSVNNTLTNCKIYDSDYEYVYLARSSDNSIRNCDIYNAYVGINIEHSHNNTVTMCNISNSNRGIDLFYSSNNNIHYNNVYDNTNYGVYNYNSESQYIANATYNYWGSADGPGGVGPGNGDNVGNNVLYDPWLIEDYHNPLITIISPQEGGLITNQNVTLIYTVDLPFTSTGSPIEYNIIGPANNTTYGEEKIYNITISVTDRAGNTATANVAFTIDKTGPIIDITSVVNNTYYNVSVTPIIEVVDINLNTITITLNGAPFVSGTTIVAEGNYTIFVQATDKAGNNASKTVSFKVDKTLPEITVTGIADNTYYNISVTPVVDITDLNLNTTLITLNDEPFISGDTVTEEGDYVLFVQATDKAGNNVSKTIYFVIDKTNPNITITGVMDGTYYNISVTPVIEFNDTNLNITTITLNGVAFVSGTTIIGEADYVLVAYASDKAGNTAQRIVSFTIDKTKPVLEILTPANNTITNQNIILTYSVSDNMDDRGNITVNILNGTVYSDEKSYTIIVNATDRAGNTANKTITFTIDRTAPIVTIIEPAHPTNKNSFTMSWSASENVQYYEVSTDGNTWTNISSATSYMFTLSKGANTIYVRGADLAGNKGTADMITVTYQEKKEGKPGIIPGFEITIFLAVLGICIILLKRRFPNP